MKRRDFVKSMALVSAGTPIIMNHMKVQSVGKNLFNVSRSAEDRVLVIIRLNGGNDGLNTVIPRDQYANLTIQRQHVLIPESSVLPITSEVGFHPVMTGMKNMYDSGKLGIVQNVGYPTQNRSHFRSMDIWSSGLIDAPPQTGWLGRQLDNENPGYPEGYPNATQTDPFAISMGNEVSATCQGILANFSHAVSNPFDTYSLQEIAEANDGTYYGDHIEYLTTLIEQANAFGSQINDAANAGSTLSTMYDEDNQLARQLRYVAQMISGGLQTKIYVLNINGFDTHGGQVDQNNTTIGAHADLMSSVSNAISAFQDDLQLLGLENRVSGMTFSEFGRQIADNASYGTDHGDAAPLFLFGSCLDINILGDNPEIPDQIVNQAGLPMQIDFRDVYASILKDWFLVDATEVQQLFEHSVTFYPLLSACNDSIGLDELALNESGALLYPNPAYNKTTVRFDSQNENVKIDVLDMNGRVVLSKTESTLTSGRHDIPLELHDLKSGQYLVRIQKESGTIVEKLNKIQS